MKTKYTIVELMKNPLTKDDIRNLNKLATDFSRKETKLAKIMKVTCPLVIIALITLAYSLLDQNIINGLETSMKVMFGISAIIACIGAGIVINLSIYAIYAELTRPFNFTYKRAFRNGEETVSMDIYKGMFNDEKSFDLSTINSTELTKNFYETITKVQNRPITIVEYDIIKHLHEKISQ
jgi:hypothetical protein